jgi:lambda family phage portal protein
MGLVNAWKGLFTSEPPNPSVLPRRRRGYDAATSSRLTSNWSVSNSSADAALKGAIAPLRYKSRDLVRNSPFARQAVRAIESNTIGAQGIKLQAQVRQQRGKRLDTKINNQIEQAWSNWKRYDSCHTAGRLCFTDIEKIIVRSLVTDGEIFVRFVRKPFGRSKIPFALELLEADQLDSEYTGRSSKKKNIWRMGIEQDSFGRAQNYAFLKKHPGDTPFGTPVGQREHMIVPASEICHIFVSNRPSQSRGEPWLSSSILSLHHLAGFQEASVIRARAASSLMGFITSPEGELDQGGEVYDNERVSQFEPGKFSYLQAGESVTVPDFDSPNSEFPEFMSAMLRSVASGCGISYESVSKDFSKTNYSSSRLSLLEDRNHYRSLQNYLIENFHSRVFDAWLEMATLSGALVLPSYDTEPERYRKVRWIPRGWDWVDPQKEIIAAKEAIKAGLKTQAQIVSENGGDLEELLPARKAEVDAAAQLNLVFDTDMSTYQKDSKMNVNSNNQSDDKEETT